MRCEGNIVLAAEGEHPAISDPWGFANERGPGAVLAVLTATHGPAYRNPGAAMAIASYGRFAGAITSGCIEADLILRADEVRRTGGRDSVHQREWTLVGVALRAQATLIKKLHHQLAERRAHGFAVAAAYVHLDDAWRMNSCSSETTPSFEYS